MAHRYFTPHIADGTAHITGPDAEHLARVLRIQAGAPLTLCDGAGTDYEAEVLSATPNRIELRILSSAPTTAEPTLRAEVFAALGKGDKMDWIVQKSVELGAAAIHPFYSEHAVARPKNEDHKTQRWQRIAAEAAKQSGRGILPTVHPPVNFAPMLKRAVTLGQALLLHPGGSAILAALPQSTPSLALVTGPEGGFSPQEVDTALEAGCRIVSLGPRILRCETAPLAALAVAMAATGNLQPAAPPNGEGGPSK